MSQRCSRSCRYLDCSKLRKRDATSSTSVEYSPIERSQPPRYPKYFRPLAADMDGQCRNSQCPYKSPTTSSGTSEEIHLSQKPNYQYQRNVTSSSELSGCPCKNLLNPQYPQRYEVIPRSPNTRNNGCNPIPQNYQKKGKVGQWRSPSNKPCQYPQESSTEVHDLACPRNEREVRRGVPCQEHCQGTCTKIMSSQREHIKKGESFRNCCKKSSANLENQQSPTSTDFDWVPSSYFMQAKSSMSESSSGYQLLFGGKPKDNKECVGAIEDDCCCEGPALDRELFMKLKGCCSCKSFT